MIDTEPTHIAAEGLDKIIPRIAKLCSPVKERLILDVGCGFGTISSTSKYLRHETFWIGLL